MMTRRTSPRSTASSVSAIRWWCRPGRYCGPYMRMVKGTSRSRDIRYSKSDGGISANAR